MKLKEQRQRMSRLHKMIADGYELMPNGQLKHRVVCAQYHGRIPKGWVVHHIDEVKNNNVPENLIAMPAHMHDKIHAAMRKTRVVLTRQELATMVKAYENLDRNKDLRVEIKIIISADRVIEPEPKKIIVEAVIVGRSGSSLYR